MACRFSKPPTHLFFVVARRPNNQFSNWACSTLKDMIFFWVVSRIIYIIIVGCKITMSLLFDINSRFQHKMGSTQMKYMFIPKMVGQHSPMLMLGHILVLNFEKMLVNASSRQHLTSTLTLSIFIE